MYEKRGCISTHCRYRLGPSGEAPVDSTAHVILECHFAYNAPIIYTHMRDLSHPPSSNTITCRSRNGAAFRCTAGTPSTRMRTRPWTAQDTCCLTARHIPRRERRSCKLSIQRSQHAGSLEITTSRPETGSFASYWDRPPRTCKSGYSTNQPHTATSSGPRPDSSKASMPHDGSATRCGKSPCGGAQ